MSLTSPPSVTEIAYATTFLASRESASITGTTIQIDGGGSMARGRVLG
jgi:enoyl-[acyl-carrier-protein] reductase (NADH)